MEIKHWVMDYETMVNCFIGCFEHYKTTERKEFVVNRNRNDLPALIEFLEENIEENQWHISYNGLNFDAQISHHILKNKWKYLKMTANEFTADIQAFASGVISNQNAGFFPPYYFGNFRIRQIDLFKMNHWDNKAKKTSLKWAEYSMDWYNVEEMPIHFTEQIDTDDKLEMVLSYCWNDVGATKSIYNYSKEHVALRKTLSEIYDLDLYSASETKISKDILAQKLSNLMNMDVKDFKKLRTPRTIVKGRDIIVDYIDFKTMKFEGLKTWVENLNIDFTNGLDKGYRHTYALNYRDVQTNFALGGVHGSIGTGVYEEKDGLIIMTSDVTSFYPNLAIRNKWSPAHIPADIFVPEYEFFFDQRQIIPKSDPINYTYKIILNATYGLSNEVNSFLYDPEFTMRVTLNGQLSLAMLYEMLGEGIPDCKPLMQNTDGLEMMIPASAKEKYLEICAEWEEITNLKLEHDQYAKMIIGDVNNYIAVNKKGKIKSKGRYEWEDQDKKKVGYFHKNKSHLVIPKAIHEYFFNGVKPEDYLESNKNIFDYCAGVKTDSRYKFVERYIKDGELVEKQLNKIVRYYISKKGNKILKVPSNDLNTTSRAIQVEAGKWMQIPCNVIDITKPFEDYDIDKEYYLEKIYKEIYNLENKVAEVSKEKRKQLELFI